MARGIRATRPHSRRMCSLYRGVIIGVAFVLVSKEVHSFTSSPSRSQHHHPLSTTKSFTKPSTTALFMSNENGSKSEKPPAKRKRRKRSVDFPSFAYNPDSVSGNKRRQKLIKFQGYSNQERVLRPSKSEVVSVPPRKEDEDKMKLSWLDKLLYLGIGSSYESGLKDIMVSASKTRLLTERAYALPGPFAAANITRPPSLDDLASRPRGKFEGFWISTPARLLSFGGAYLTFPYLTKFLDGFVTMQPEQLDDITSKFAPGISILYGTFVSLTLSILYTRQRDIQDNVALECSYLVLLTRNLLSIFKRNKDKAIEAGQCAADQIRTLVRSSRGAELMLLIYSDPYARMLDLMDYQEQALYDEYESFGPSGNLLMSSRDILRDLNRLRANRLSGEALALPPTHFLILNFLTFLILLGYTISILPTTDVQTGEPSVESSVLFGVLTTIYGTFECLPII